MLSLGKIREAAKVQVTRYRDGCGRSSGTLVSGRSGGADYPALPWPVGPLCPVPGQPKGGHSLTTANGYSPEIYGCPIPQAPYQASMLGWTWRYIQPLPQQAVRRPEIRQVGHLNRGIASPPSSTLAPWALTRIRYPPWPPVRSACRLLTTVLLVRPADIAASLQ